MDLVEIVIVAKNLTKPAFAEARAGMTALEATTTKFRAVANGAAVATATVAAASVKMAAEFQSKMELLHTQAKVPQAAIAGLSKGILSLAGQVGFSPKSLAESLFHVESAFGTVRISGSKALEITKIAAEGAAVGHAKLVDVTNALTGAMAAGLPGVKNASEAMGVLNATVGVGDMNMQQLSQALGTGVLPTLKGFGLSIQDIGAALATFGDNNKRGAEAATSLRMAVQALAHPVATGAKMLADLGLQTNTLSLDMQKGGLKLALNDLINHMNKAGVTAKQQGDVITTVFGKRAGIGLNILIDQINRLNSKYKPLNEGAKTFGEDWAKTQQQFSQQVKELESGFHALMIVIGTKLMPVVKAFVELLLRHKTATAAVFVGLMLLVSALAAVRVGMVLVTVATWAFKDSQIALENGLKISRIGAVGMAAASARAATAAAAHRGTVVTLYSAMVAGEAVTKAWNVALAKSRILLAWDWIKTTAIYAMNSALLAGVVAWGKIKDAALAARIWLDLNWMKLSPLYLQNSALLLLTKGWGLFVEGLIRAERQWLIFRDGFKPTVIAMMNAAIVGYAAAWGKVTDAVIAASTWVNLNWMRFTPVNILNTALLGLVTTWGKVTDAAIAARVWLDLNWMKVNPVTLMRSALLGLGGVWAAVKAGAISAAAGIGVLRAAFMALGTATRVVAVVAVIAAIAVALANMWHHAAPPDSDKMVNSITKLGETGKNTGESLRVLGDGFKNVGTAIAILDKPSVYESVDRFLTGLLGMKSTPDKGANAVLGSLDDALTSLVNNGHLDMAKVALENITKRLAKQGISAEEVKSHLSKYSTALEANKIAQDLTGKSMGRFGSQAVKVQAALSAQQLAADGLRKSLQALDAVNQGAYDAETKFYQAISDATKGIKDNGRTLDVHTDAGRRNRDLISGLAAATDDLTSKMADQKRPWSEIIDQYNVGYNALVKTAMGMGDTRTQAIALANSLLHVPKKTVADIKGDITDLQNKITAAKKQLASLPPSKQAKIKGEISDLEHKLAKARADLNALNGKTVTTHVVTQYAGIIARTSSDKNANGIPDLVEAHASGGWIVGPGTDTSDSILARLSRDEFVVNAKDARRNRRLLELINAGRIRGFASGGSVGKSESQARASAAGDFSISAYGREAGYQHTPFERALALATSLGDLVSALNKWHGIIKSATSGGTERRLLHMLDGAARSLIDHEKALAKVNAALSVAKDKLNGLKDAAKQLSDSVSSSVVSNGGIMAAAQNSAGFTGAGGLAQQMGVNAAAAQNFAAMLAKLKKMGLNGQSLSEIAQAGMDEGGAVAQRLLSSSPAQIKQINALEKQLQASAGAAGKTAADGMYGAGIKAAQGVVHGLEKRQKQIDAVMENAAKALERALKKAFGIRSHAVGGVAGGLSRINEYGPELVRLPQGSMVYPAGQSRQLVAAHGHSRPIEVSLHLDGKVAAKALINPLRGEIRHISGGNVQKALGRGNA